ncbi:MAG: hypothetical protein ABIG69_19425 [Bacteroidota bacterium]
MLSDSKAFNNFILFQKNLTATAFCVKILMFNTPISKFNYSFFKFCIVQTNLSLYLNPFTLKTGIALRLIVVLFPVAVLMSGYYLPPE